jgi:simple sugar transport system ATP-binding protein
MTGQRELVRMTNIGKSYGRVEALSGVDFSVGVGEIVGLVGDNGAGKSTLIKLLSGVAHPDAGEIYIRGEQVMFRDANDAIRAGIETIYQGAALIDDLTVARNLFLGREPTRRIGGLLPRLNWRYMREESRSLLRRMGLGKDVDPEYRVEGLSGGERQSIAIARAMFFDADLIILDEPTNNLGVEETRRVLEFVREAKVAGRSSIFITHNILHVFQVVDRIVVLRHGRKVADLLATDTTVQEVESLITDVPVARCRRRTGLVTGQTLALDGGRMGAPGGRCRR